jgi:hypothetical protein
VHKIWYIAFLALLSYVILCDYNPVYKAFPESSLGLVISIPEVVLIVWVVTFALDEIRKFETTDRKIFKAKLYSYLYDIWNGLTLAALFLFFVSLVLRFIPNPQCFLAAR